MPSEARTGNKPRPWAGVVTRQHGYSLVEVIIATVIGTLTAAGTFMAFIMSQQLLQGASTQVEATYDAQQTIERFRNKVACRQSGEQAAATWFDESCNAALPIGVSEDELPPDKSGGVTKREYQVFPGEDFDGDGQPDYLKVVTKVTWTPPK